MDDAALLPDVYHGDAHGRPDWDAVARAGRFAGAIIKATQGIAYPPAEWFIANWDAIRIAGGDRYGIDWFRGCYHYLTFDDNPVAQADYFLATVDHAGGWDHGDLVPIVDVERGDDAGHFRARPDEVVECTARWVAHVEARLGPTARVMLYGSGAMRALGITSRMGCDLLWAPRYAPELGDTDAIGWSRDRVALWQYTDGHSNQTSYPHSVPGIGPCDLSVFLGGGAAGLRKRLLWYGPAR